jgi:Rieske 2Fe-2S family protein
MNNETINTAIADYKSGYSLEQRFYRDQAIYDAEINKLFFKHWLFAGHDSQIPNRGDFFTIEIDQESVIVVRTAKGDVKAHLNVCRHRGSRVCLEKSGNKQRFTCPYHAWSYDLDGKLIAARFMSDEFKTTENALHSAHVELLGGLIFISVAETPLAISQMREKMDGIFNLFGFNTLKLAEQRSYAIPANWKLAVENYQECYHCAPSHQEFAKIHAMARSPAEFTSIKESFHDDNKLSHSVFDCYYGYAKEGQEGFQYGRNPLLKGNLSGSLGGKSVAPLLGNISKYDGGASEFMLGPVSFFLMYDDHIVVYRFLPKSIDECRCEIFWLVHQDAVEGEDYDIDTLTWLWDVTIKADKKIIVDNQLGVNSQFYQPGKLSKMEVFEQAFLDWYVETLAN